MSDLFYFILPAIPAFLIALSISIKYGYDEEYDSAMLGIALFLFGIAATTLVFTYTRSTHVIFGILSLTVPYSLLIIFLLRQFFNFYPKLWIISTLLALNLLIFVISIPVSVISGLRNGGDDSQKEIQVHEISIDFMGESLKNIQESFTALQENIDQESKQVKQSISELLKEVSQKNAELRNQKKKQEELLATIKHYETLLTVTKEQSKEIRLSLQGDKYIDYLVGLLIGIASAVVMYFLPKLARRQGRS